jgi:hypothetical protein
MDAFRFSPELFEHRNDVLEALQEAGYYWLSHFSAVDPLHDLYGLEVCGIADQEDAAAILALLRRLFPDWRLDCMQYKDHGREPGWKVRLHRDPERDSERWQIA